MSGSDRNSNKAVLKAIRAIVGPEGMRDLYADRGGSEICIPRECDADHWMSRIFGEEIANRVCEHFAVINADGKVVGDVRCYVPIQNSRVLLAIEQVEEEVKQALIAGKSVNDICREVGVSVRNVRGHVKFLREQGIIPQPAAPHLKVGARPVHEVQPKRRQLNAEKLAAVDEMLMSGRTNRAIIVATGVGMQSVRQRRKRLLDAGRLDIGERLPGTHSDSVADAIGHVAKGGAVESLDEVRS